MIPTRLRFPGISQFLRYNRNPMRNRSFLANLKSYTGPTRKEKDTIGEIDVPNTCLWGAQTQRYFLKQYSINHCTYPLF